MFRVNKTLVYRLINFLIFYIGWGFCLAGAVKGRPFVGPVLVAGLLLYHLVQTKFYRPDLVLIPLMAILGTLNDSLYLNLGLVHYAGGYELFPYLAPLWITAIWVLFAMSVNHSLIWLSYSLPLAALFGAGGGAMSYFAGKRVGAISFPHGEVVTLLGIALVWFFLMPAISWLASRLRGS